jgi:hypothetical protein
VFTARYALSPYIKQIRFVFKGLIHVFLSRYLTFLGGIEEKCVKRHAIRSETASGLDPGIPVYKTKEFSVVLTCSIQCYDEIDCINYNHVGG